MKIKSLSTSSFGKFETNTIWDDFSDSINVFYGENEAGKSTIFQMIVCLLYGFNKTSKENNLLVNRFTNELNINGEIKLNGGSVYAERHLKSKATLKVSYENTQYVHDNKPLPYANHITKKTYEDIYALELSRLTSFKDNTWSEIEELLLNNYSGDTFRTSKQVISDIENEMNTIKRKSERGNSLIKSLEEERRQLYKNKKRVQENLNEVENLKEKLNHIDILMEEIKHNKSTIEKRLGEYRKYFPIMEINNERKDLEVKLKNFESINFIDEHQYLENKTLLKKLYIEMDDISSKLSKLVYEKRKLVDRIESDKINESELKEIIDNHIISENLKEDTEELKNKLILRTKDFKKEFENSFSENFNESHFEEIIGLNYLNIKSIIAEIDELNEEIKIVKRNKRTSTSGNVGSKVFIMTLLAISGAAVNFIDLGEFDKIINSIGLVLLGVMSVKAVDTIVRSKHKIMDEEDLFKERELLRRRLINELNGIKLSSIVEEFIGVEFLTQLSAMKQIAEGYLELKMEYDNKLEKLNFSSEKVNKYLKSYYGMYENTIRSLDEMVDKVEANKKMKSNIGIINGKLDLLNDQIFDIENNLNNVEEEVNNVEKLLKESSGDSLEDGIGKLKLIKHWKLRLNELTIKLSKYEYVDDALKRFTNEFSNVNDSIVFDESYMITEVNILNARINDSLVERTSVEKDIESLIDKTNLGEVESELMRIDEVISDKKIRYDKLQLMHYIIQKNDEEYKKENQPDVFKKAGKYLSLITSGKYVSLDIIEVKEKNNIKKEIFVLCESNRIKVDETFSSGTLNQIYLSLRLALIDQLDIDNEILPICFDELLVNWDRKRLDNTLSLIREISKERQVFIFTCHDWFVDEVKSYSNVKIHNL